LKRDANNVIRGVLCLKIEFVFANVRLRVSKGDYLKSRVMSFVKEDANIAIREDLL
jgi:hypothetical protein